MLLIAAVASFMAPTQIAGSIRDSDYPRKGLRQDAGGTVSLALQISPDGSVERCDVRLSSSPKVLDEASCKLATARFRYSPARNAAGNPVHSVIVQDINWRLGSGEKFYKYAELVLTLKALPAPFEPGETRQIALLTSKDGAMIACLANWEADSPVLARVACREARAGFRPEAVRDKAGVAVEAVRIIGVRFETVASQAKKKR